MPASEVTKAEAAVYFEEFNKNHTYMIRYFRNAKGQRKGVAIAFKTPDGHVMVGFSKCNKKDRWSKFLGLYYAITRASLLTEPRYCPDSMHGFGSWFMALVHRNYGTTLDFINRLVSQFGPENRVLIDIAIHSAEECQRIGCKISKYKFVKALLEAKRG